MCRPICLQKISRVRLLATHFACLLNFSIDDIPEAVLRQMATCQTAANEFLRQYWSSIYPNSTEGQLSTYTPAQRAAKASKMVSYLTKTPEKVEAIIKSARQDGIDVSKRQAKKFVFEAFTKAVSSVPGI